MCLEGNCRKFFDPHSLALVGVSRKPGSLGHKFLQAVRQFGYRGRVYPVHPTVPEMEGLRCYPSLEALPEVPDLAVIMVKKEQVARMLEACGKKGIHHVIIITAGFRETGDEGREREMELLKIAYRYGLRFLGPNCMGLFNTGSQIRLNASFSPTQPLPGTVAFLSQSGALAVAILEMARTLRLGFSKFVSLGNKADLTEVDFLPFLLEDPETRVVMLYQEGIERPGTFREWLYRLSCRKPVLALLAGRSQSAARAAVSHTGALTGSTEAVEALFRQCGVVSLERVQDFVETALAFSLARLPGGPRVAVITNAGGPGILTVEALERAGLQVVPFQEKTRRRLRQLLPEEAAVENPVDMIASATEITYRETLHTVLIDEQIDAVVVVIVRPPVDTTPARIAREFQTVLPSETDKPIFVVLMAHWDETAGIEAFHRLNIPVFAYPDSAARALAAMWTYARWKQQPPGKRLSYPVDQEKAARLLAGAKTSARFLSEYVAWQILQAYGFPLPAFAMVQHLEDALETFRDWNKPIVLKLLSPQIVHKSDAGVVWGNLDSEDAIRAAWERLQQVIAAHPEEWAVEGVLVQEWIPGQREWIAGVHKDARLGHVLMFGLGGVLVEVWKDVSFRVVPLSDRDAREMLREIRASKLLDGTRHLAPVKENDLVDMLLRLSQLVSDFPEISSLDLNPIMATDDGQRLAVVDVRIEIYSPEESRSNQEKGRKKKA